MPLRFALLLIPLLPLAGAILSGLFGKRWSNRTVNLISCTPVGISLFLAVLAFRDLLDPLHQGAVFSFDYFPWIQAGPFLASFGFQLDALTGVMLLVVTGIGFVIHIYATGYMAREGGYYRFFAYLNLFMFSMLILVLANNFLLMFVGWEGVGLCSYLLIGFYFRKDSAANAGKKAFIVNRIGDFGFMLAIFLIFWNFGEISFSSVFLSAHQMAAIGSLEAGGALITTICLLLFVGAIGKSAQIPLHVWLPDAMEGPTPVSALIHAATMVTAGVYMVARCHALFLLAPLALTVVAVIGCLTALFAASIGLAQTDIKKVLAYSTVSQLGFMFLGCGVGAFSAGIFHLMTHAFFKALLFLGAGSVIHAMSGEQDIRKMGGLRSRIPVTFWTMLIGTLAIAGFFPFAGFFSKDEILWKTLSGGHWILWLAGMTAATMTSFYMFRMIYLAFFGESRVDHEVEQHIHESPSSMTVPLRILALGSLTAGWLGIPHVFHLPNYFERFLEPVFMHSSHEAVAMASSPMEWTAMSLSLGVAVSGMLLAYSFYLQNTSLPGALAARFSWIYATLWNKYWVDELYALAAVRPLVWISENLLWKLVDVGLIDGSIDGTGRSISAAGMGIRRIHSGYLRSYAGWILLGAVSILLYFSLLR